MTDSEVLDFLFDSSVGILGDHILNEKQSGDADMIINTLSEYTDPSWSNFLLDDIGNYSDDFLNSLLGSNLDDNSKMQQIKLNDHAYSVALPTSPNSDSGLSSGPYSPESSGSTSSAVEDLATCDFEQTLFAPLGLKNYAADDAVDQHLVESLSDPTTPSDTNETAFDFDSSTDNSPMDSSVHRAITTTTDLKTKVIRVISVNTNCQSQHISLDDESDSHMDSCNSQFPEIQLSDEEKHLLMKEGIVIPTHLPLTREEEKILRSVRRRIRNKASARNSRRKKQDYMEALEERVKICSAEKQKLEKKVTLLEKQNGSLLSQLKQLQNLVTESTKQTARAGTCAMILALSFALVLWPNFQSFNGSSENDGLQQQVTSALPGRSRSLLSANDLSSYYTDKEQRFIPFVNFDKMSSLAHPSVKQSIHDAVEDSRDPVTKPVDSGEVIHMEIITKMPDDKQTMYIENATKSDYIVGSTRIMRMEFEDEL